MSFLFDLPRQRQDLVKARDLVFHQEQRDLIGPSLLGLRGLIQRLRLTFLGGRAFRRRRASMARRRWSAAPIAAIELAASF